MRQSARAWVRTPQLTQKQQDLVELWKMYTSGKQEVAQALRQRSDCPWATDVDRGDVGACLRGEYCSDCGAEPEVHDTVGPLPQERKMLEAICSITRSKLPLIVF